MQLFTDSVKANYRGNFEIFQKYALKYAII